MKPGEFVNWEGKPAKVEYIGVRTLDDNYCLFPEQSDFPAAVAALQSLVCTDSLMAALIEDRNEMIKIIEDKDAESIKRLRDFAKMLGLASQPKEGEEDKWVYLTDGVWIYLDKDKKE